MILKQDVNVENKKILCSTQLNGAEWQSRHAWLISGTKK